jgi:hypothetical protein
VAEETAEVPTVNIDVASTYKKPRLIALLFCNFFNVTGNRKPNLLGIFDRMAVDHEKKKTPNFFMFIKLAGVLGPSEIHVYSPRGERIMAALLEGRIPPTSSDEIVYAQAMINIELEVKEEGIYWFDVLYQGNSLGGNGLGITFKQREE